jgi:hypothetical protein
MTLCANPRNPVPWKSNSGVQVLYEGHFACLPFIQEAIKELVGGHCGVSDAEFADPYCGSVWMDSYEY